MKENCYCVADSRHSETNVLQDCVTMTFTHTYPHIPTLEHTISFAVKVEYLSLDLKSHYKFGVV